MERKNKRKKEEIAEDYCFVCKEGGLLMLCDYDCCLKVYHPNCVGKDNSILETKERWFCGRHYCHRCGKPAKFRCFACPFAICRKCPHDLEFALARGRHGFCDHCLKLALLIEDRKDVDSDGDMVDFNAEDSYEFLFKGYWEIMKLKDGITSEHVHSAYSLLKNGKNKKCGSNFNQSCGRDDVELLGSEDESQESESDFEDLCYGDPKQVYKRKKTKGKLTTKGKLSTEKEFVGWASKSLLEFLSSIGKDTTEELSQHDVTTMIIEHCKEHKLFHPEKKKKVICDKTLRSLLRRQAVNKNSIYKLLTPHFAENLTQVGDLLGSSPEEDTDNASVLCKRQRKLSLDGKPVVREGTLNLRQGCFASIVTKNIKLVYLKKSLVEKLAVQLDTFESKMLGSFVRIKSDPYDYLQKNSHLLEQVTGIKKTSVKDGLDLILLQLSNVPKDVPLCKLSDDDFTEDECDDLRQRVKNGLLKVPTVVELEQKVRSLHEDITKHWIEKELVRLQNLINRANEKGWRRELYEYMDRWQLLKAPSEQSRLLEEIPEVIADLAEFEPPFEHSLRGKKNEDDASLHSPLIEDFQTSRSVLKSWNNGIDTTGSEGKHFAGSVPVGKSKKSDSHVTNQLLRNSNAVATEAEPADAKRHQPSQEEKQHQPGTECLGQKLVDTEHETVRKDGPTNVDLIEVSDDEGQDQPVDVELGTVKEKGPPMVNLIESSDDEEQDASSAANRQPSEDEDGPKWYCISPTGLTTGPYAKSVIKEWSDSSTCPLQFKVYRVGQSQDDAIPLTDFAQK
ncbi:hypothetical protein SLE2022_039160 [Rubroshorea leprosula]